MSKKKENKVTKSVEDNIVKITKAIINIYALKEKALNIQTDKIDDNSEENRQKLFEVKSQLRDVQNEFHYTAKELFDNPEYTGRKVKTNYIDEFTGYEPTPIRRYAYHDLELMLREDYEFCKNAPVRKSIKKMNKARRKFFKLNNNYTKGTKLKKNLVNMV